MKCKTVCISVSVRFWKADTGCNYTQHFHQNWFNTPSPDNHSSHSLYWPSELAQYSYLQVFAINQIENSSWKDFEGWDYREVFVYSPRTFLGFTSGCISTNGVEEAAGVRRAGRIREIGQDLCKPDLQLKKICCVPWGCKNSNGLEWKIYEGEHEVTPGEAQRIWFQTVWLRETRQKGNSQWTLWFHKRDLTYLLYKLGLEINKLSFSV